MATSLKTKYYKIGKYASADITSYLVDYNGAMDTIDSAVHGVSEVADEAKATSDANLNNIAALAEGQTATNKNVESMGKTVTAQGVEIDNLKKELANVAIGEMVVEHPTCVNGGTGYVSARSIGGYFYGNVSLQMQTGTCPMDKTIDGVSYSTIAYVAGNPWSLTETLTDKGVSYGLILGGTNEVRKNVADLIVFYDAVTNTTRFAVSANGFTVSSGETGQLHARF